MARALQKGRAGGGASKQFTYQSGVEGSRDRQCHLSPGAVKRQSRAGPPPTLPTTSCTAVRTVASSLNTEDTFRKVVTTFSGSDVSV